MASSSCYGVLTLPFLPALSASWRARCFCSRVQVPLSARSRPIGSVAALVGRGAAAGGWEFGKAAYTGDTFYSQGKSWLPGPEDLVHALLQTNPHAAKAAEMGREKYPMPEGGAGLPFGFTDWRHFLLGKGADEGFNFREHVGVNLQDRPAMRIDAAFIAEMTRPSGTQDVRVVNQQPPNITVHAPISITGVADPQAAANAVIGQLGAAVKNAADTQFSD